MEKAFKAIEEVQEYLGLEPDNESMMELDMCKSGYVSFYDDKGTSILLPFYFLSTKRVSTIRRLTT